MRCPDFDVASSSTRARNNFRINALLFATADQDTFFCAKSVFFVIIGSKVGSLRAGFGPILGDEHSSSSDQRG